MTFLLKRYQMPALSPKQIGKIIRKRYGFDPDLVSYNQFFKEWKIRPSDKIVLYDEYQQNLEFQKKLNEYFRATGEDLNKILGNRILFDEMNHVNVYKEALAIHTFGIAGVGKSIGTMELLNINNAIDHTNTEFHLDFDKPDFVIKNCLNPEWEFNQIMATYDWSELIAALQKWGKYGTFFFGDEMPIPHGKNSRIILDSFENIARVAMRKLHLRIMVLNPFLLDLTSMNWFVQFIGTKRDEWLSLALLYSNQMILKGVILLPIRLTFLEGRNLLDEYERISLIRKDEIRKAGGYSAVYTSEALVDKMAYDFYQFAKQRGAETKEDLKGFIEIFKPMATFPAKASVLTKVKTILKFPDLIKDVLPTLYNQADIEATSEIEETEGSFENPEIIPDGFQHSPQKTLSQYAKEYMEKNGEIKTNTLIIEGYFGGKTVDQIGEIKGIGVTGSRVSQILGSEGHLADRFSGDIWEGYFSEILLGIKPITAGSIPIPDIIEYIQNGVAQNWYMTREGYKYIEHHEDYDSRFGKLLDQLETFGDLPGVENPNLIVWSLKCRNKNLKYDNYQVATKTRNLSDCYPELHFCQQHELKTFNFGYVNLKWDATNYRRKTIPLNTATIQMSRYKEYLIPIDPS